MSRNILILILFGLHLPIFATNLIVNGDFSNATPAINPTCCANPLGNVPTPGWTISNSTALSFVINDGFNLDGNYLWLNDSAGPTPTASQDLTINAGEHRLTGNYRSRIAVGSSLETFAIRFTDLSNNQILETLTFGETSIAQTPSAWESFDITRSFSTNSLRVSFISQFGADIDYAIDNIVFEETTTVPEPSVFFLSLIALIFLKTRQRLFS